MRKKIKRKIKLFLVLFFTAVLLTSYFIFGEKTINISPVGNENSQNSEISVIIVGDIMLDRGVELEIKKNNDWKWPFLEIADYLKNADVVFGNLEGPISNKGENVGSIYSFRADPNVIEGLSYAGFDVLSLANNHTLDYGRLALEDTFSRLQNADISYVGGGINETEAKQVVINKINGTKIGFLAYTNLCSSLWNADKNKAGINCISESDFENVGKEIQNAKSSVDVLIVSLHSGEEYVQTLTDFQTSFAKMAVDAGADIVVEGHPHVVQKNETYKNGYIFYSLGNFVFDQNFSEETMKGQMVKILIENKKIKKITPIDITINKDFQPELSNAVSGQTQETESKINAETEKETVQETQTQTEAQVETQSSLPQVSLSAATLEQGDTLIINVDNLDNGETVSGTFDGTSFGFFKYGNWYGILGIDAKKNPGQYILTINFSNGEKIEKTIKVIKRNFPVTELAFTPELEEQGYNADSVATNNLTDSEKLYETMAVSNPTFYFDKPFIYPLDKIVDVGAFGNIRKTGDVSLQHLGVDLDADMGTPVYAVNDGKVTGTLSLTDYGKTIVIDHGMGIFSIYLHLNKFNIANGQMATKGEVIGYSGNTGYSIAPHLHFSIKANSASVDPLRFIKATQENIE
jgi:poly-gamma-glutamate synthesis protein (capsule biosynthesis protein)